METLWKKASDRPQLLDGSCVGEGSGSVKCPTDNIRLGNPGFDLAGTDHTKVLHRALCGLCYSHQSWDATAAALLARKRAGRLRDSAGKHPADLEKAARGCGSTYPEETHLLRARGYRSPQQAERDNGKPDRTATNKT
jgi:hypothetical protein